ncbi:preprotein translocase subunit TatA [Kribbia dieselivorans]|uniref:preprotein translocase subunit TatA n=1 Tax=Kribbia dieselivorans TaxID=331526 RepID=UPI000A727484|nr:preprotein translocase subunit TatA [Kribbia dieselivorans]
MDFFGINGWELVALIVLAVLILGPERMPQYAAKLAHAVKRMRDMSNSAKEQIKGELGPEFEDVDWRQYDPRRYDPRRIVREALLEPSDDPARPTAGVTAGGETEVATYDPSLPTKFDPDAT